ncbi:unnamed protein product [Clonostachys solani]|uniref:Zn(2)-C6 fungal-type domain-containing protein n=1 Tax=Clonostachys solani TaxID=160281 RepID=A0A9N9ZHZ5_9HYPO|nr:unnamed protein product [Clonostachys solani]
MPKQACDSCRQRKVKCDQLSPTCSPCQLSSLLCSYYKPRRKRGPKPRHQSLESVGSRQTVQPGDGIPRSLATPESPVPAEDASRGNESGSASALNNPVALCHQALLSALAAEGITPHETVEACINIYMQSVFPLLPVVCEPTLRSHTSLILPSVMAGVTHSQSGWTPESIALIRLYSLTISLCALVSHIHPCIRYPQDDTIPSRFLELSQATLRAFADYDITHPTATSLAIRIFQASCYQMTGNSCLSWHKVDEAVRLAIQMQLHDEKSYEGLDFVEATLRRNALRYLYSLDRSNSLLNGKKQNLNELRLQSFVTTCFDFDERISLLDQNRPENEGCFERHLMMGFQKNYELWKHGFGILFDLDLFLSANSRASGGRTLDIAQMGSLKQALLRFSSILDDVPEFIMSPPTICNPDRLRETHQRLAFWIQKSNIMLSYYFLQLFVLNRFAAAELLSLLWLSNDRLSIDWKKTDIAHEVLNLMKAVPLRALHANGEPGAEKLRYICATLLEVMQGQESIQGKETLLWVAGLFVEAKLASV